MIQVSINPLFSSAFRICITRPSIISLGATTSAPACAWLSAICANTSMVASFKMLLSSTIPSCPNEEYGSRATSENTTISGTVPLMVCIARCIKPLGLSASVPALSLRLSSTLANIKTPLSPMLHSSRTSFCISSKLMRKTFGMDGISCLTPLPSTTKSGTIKSSG